MKDDLVSEGGPVPTTPEEFAAEVQVIVLDPAITTAAALDIQLGQLAIAYAETVLPGGIRLRFGPWTTTEEWDAVRQPDPRFWSGAV